MTRTTTESGASAQALHRGRVTRVPGFAALLLAAAALLGSTGVDVQGQEPVPQPPVTRADSLRADSLRADSLRAALLADSLGARPDTLPPQGTVPVDTVARAMVDWVPADSATQALLSRQGYTITRYQGAVVGFDARTRTLQLYGDSAERAAVLRGDSTLAIGDTIQFNDSTQVADLRGDELFLEDPTQRLMARGKIVYDVARRQGIVTNLCTTVENEGNDWFVCGAQAAIVGDTTGGSSRFYAHDSRFTTCDLDVPHYHFEARNAKIIQDRLLVGRPAIMYIEGVPVAWFPFFFQDLRRGRRSGFLPPRFGLAEFVRSGSNYRRTVDNVGYYFALSDYYDATVWMDWRSGARPTEGDPGSVRLNGDFRYRWLNRFMGGSVGVTLTNQQDGTRMQQYSWSHHQDFSAQTNLRMSLNYTTNTRIQRDNALLPSVATGTILSQLNFNQRRGPVNYSIGGTARQFPGRDLKEISFPNFNLSSSPLSAGDWLVWTPRISLTNSLTLDERLSGSSGLQLVPGPGGTVDTTFVQANRRDTRVTIGTPLRILGWDWQNSFSLVDAEDDFPQLVQVVDTLSPTGFTQRMYERTFLTTFDWQTSFALPGILQGTWNFVPNIGVQNVEPGAGFLVRSERTGTRFVSQSKRLVYGASISPTFFSLYPGIGPFERFRHAIETRLSYGYSPAARVSDEFLAAIGRDPRGYLGVLTQSRLSLTLNTNIEARRRARPAPGADTTGVVSLSGDSEKVRVLSVGFSSLSYDFIKADSTGNGLTNQTFNYTVHSDLLPGFNLQVSYDLFRGSVMSDTARFDPYRTSVSAALSLDAHSPLVRGLASLFGVRLDTETERLSEEELLGPPRSDDPFDSRSRMDGGIRGGRLSTRQIAPGQGWRAQLSYSSSRRRPAEGENVIILDPELECAQLSFSPVAYEQCLERVRLQPPDEAAESPGTIGRPIFVSPSLSSLSGSTSFNLTRQWMASWQTSYDFTTGKFASHVVGLQREMHDWFANFAFTRTPTGAFSFSFFISLKAEPDLKFDYNRQSYRGR